MYTLLSISSSLSRSGSRRFTSGYLLFSISSIAHLMSPFRSVAPRATRLHILHPVLTQFDDPSPPLRPPTYIHTYLYSPLTTPHLPHICTAPLLTHLTIWTRILPRTYSLSLFIVSLYLLFFCFSTYHSVRCFFCYVRPNYILLLFDTGYLS
ncbi:hypothetical protein R3P38DRAFT_615148 [Favolaschia claudopus]|uniref:Uncharacterized protein n=1 Tax=Favolaschia claudopus TaxID=2862362 RepID=A0AAW0CD40_9AGAR